MCRDYPCDHSPQPQVTCKKNCNNVRLKVDQLDSNKKRQFQDKYIQVWNKYFIFLVLFMYTQKNFITKPKEKFFLSSSKFFF